MQNRIFAACCYEINSFKKRNMNMEMKPSLRKLPVGIQDFEKLRTDHCLYVDKTSYLFYFSKRWLKSE